MQVSPTDQVAHNRRSTNHIPRGVMIGSTVTAVVLVGLAIGIGVWDVYAGIRWGGDATVSAVIQSWAKSYPVLPLLVGIVMGHLFWPRFPGGGSAAS